MNFLELAEKRYSVRAYDARTVEREKIEYVIECARLAPSAVNRQPWHFYVATSDESLRALCNCYHNPWLAQAPAIIAVCVDSSAAWTRQNDSKNHADIDGAIATEHICLAAASVGLGTCWVCNFDMNEACKALKLPQGHHPVALIPIGYPADKASERHSSRKSPDEITSWI